MRAVLSLGIFLTIFSVTFVSQASDSEWEADLPCEESAVEGSTGSEGGVTDPETESGESTAQRSREGEGAEPQSSLLPVDVHCFVAEEFQQSS